jgi:transposase-like protein
VAKEYPGTLLEFEHWFRTDEACRDYLAQLRWPQGFECPQCRHKVAWRTKRGLYCCTSCKAATSVTAGTTFERSRLPLRSWFRAAWWLTNQKSGINALSLQRLLGLGSYETAWLCLHKLRRAMVRPGRELLSGRVEVDETLVGGLTKGNPSRHKKMVVIIAVEVKGAGMGRIRLQKIPDSTEPSITAFVRKSVATGSELITDGSHAYKHLIPHGYTHHRNVLQHRGREASNAMLPRVHRIASLLKRWLLGIHQGRVSRHQMDHYLNEFAFRFNRRLSPRRGMLFYRLMQQCVAVPAAPYSEVVGST